MNPFHNWTIDDVERHNAKFAAGGKQGGSTPLPGAHCPPVQGSHPPAAPIVCEIKNIGHVPSFKNSKLVRNNVPHTKPEYQQWMNIVTLSLKSQLSSALATRGIGTSTGPLPPSLIASLLPLDDSRKWVVSLSVRVQRVSKGNEGASITIKRVREVTP